MELSIRPVRLADSASVIELSLQAWQPVFRSFQSVLGSQIYAMIWPDWETSQSKAIASICQGDGKTVVWVAELAGTVVGFIAYELDEGSRIGDVTYLAVDPDYQNQGVGMELNRFALSKMRECGMMMARVETGG